jgi:four helix bundle protein
LTQQLHRAVVSVAANIAEGAAKRTMAEYRMYLDHASGSLNDVEYYIHLSCRLGYIDNKIAQHLFALETEAARTLNGLITAIEK